MTGLNRLTLETGTVQDAYSKMVQRSEEMHEFLNTVQVLLSEVDDKDKNMYVGDKSPAALRDELERFAQEFEPVYAEIELLQNNSYSVVKIK